MEHALEGGGLGYIATCEAIVRSLLLVMMCTTAPAKDSLVRLSTGNGDCANSDKDAACTIIIVYRQGKS